ncbi:alkaline phosphatase family protein [Actinomadura luteofluorescens]|uniref:alkaline phosphatase family protein n=1 Tax=Actinomadura luteofluorescens TaxID=46163 RepID=UPI00363F50E1
MEKSPEWASTAVILAYDDSDGWYDHAPPRITNGSNDPAQDGPACRKVRALGGYQDRCGPSQRLPLIVISPYARVNHVDHRPLEQASILRFIEDNWGAAVSETPPSTPAPMRWTRCSTSPARGRPASSSTWTPERSPGGPERPLASQSGRDGSRTTTGMSRSEVAW